MKILVTGADGMVGSAVKEVFDDHELILTDIKDMDVRDYDAVMSYADKKPNLILHLAAETDLEVCNKNPKNTYLTNHTGTLHVMLLAKKLDIPMIYISTAGVFDGKKSYYTEWDQPNPVNHYGRSKWFGEIALSSYNKVWIFRAGWMMGGGPDIDKKFVNKIFKQLKAGNKKIYGIDDIFGSPTYANDLVATIKNVIKHKAPYGIYHCVGGGAPSRYEVANAIIVYLKSSAELVRVKQDYFYKEFFCPRAGSEVLKNIKLDGMGLSKMRWWQDSLKEYINKCYTV